jgi:WhiB family redox-sensing transcriptional regulator
MTVHAAPLDYPAPEDRLTHEAAVATARTRLTQATWHGDRPDPLATVDSWRAARRWHARAACIDYGPNLWFPPQTTAWAVWQDRGSVAHRTDPFAEARAICARCPVRAECLADGLTHDEGYGMIGGLDPAQRKKMRGGQG